LDVTVEERDVDRSEIFGAEEAFFCGTAWEVTPITSIDRLAIGDGQPGPLTRRLQRHYEAVCRGTVAARDTWRLPIYG
ncbi:MAG: branched-chain amino acid aminotransferase, partial [Pseudomonadota bacterium]|nr:branched-chain amino acid aminotransferase [Pseudomonadota bacterium]